MARPGGQSDWLGPRLPSGPRPQVDDELEADPAQGEAVPRCLACGVPGGQVYALGTVRERQVCIRLCWRCLVHANPWILDPDPLTVMEGAA